MKQEYDNYSIEDDEEEEGGKEPSVRSTMWSLMPKVLVAPASGWEKVRKEGPSPEVAVIRFLLPFCLLAGGADFFRLLYEVQLVFSDLLVEAVITFCSFFLGYYVSLVLLKLFLPRESKEFPVTRYGRLLVIGSTVSLAIFHILYVALPMFDFLIEFFPLWTVFLIYKGTASGCFEEERHAFSMGVVCVVVICSPVLIKWIFSFFT